jgi:serine protease AprX
MLKQMALTRFKSLKNFYLLFNKLINTFIMIFRPSVKFLIVVLFINVQLLSAQVVTKYWIYFKDKGNNIDNSLLLREGSPLYKKAQNQLTRRAIKRREKVLPSDQIVDAQDLPVNQSYIDSIKNIGGVYQQQVCWMNAASFKLTVAQFNAIKNFSFVKAVETVQRFNRKEILLSKDGNSILFPKLFSSDYGISFAQYDAVKIPEVHNLDITGEGVLVGMLDSGFRWRVHESLERTQVIAEHDFVNNDDTTANQMGDPYSQDMHGTYTMSLLGGYMPGKLIGPAYNSQFILAKTEYVPTETQIEEDWWAAGIEWMEKQGADVVSSSVGYDIFDNGNGYRWENGDFNGRTSVTSRAASRAARLGVVVANGIGNGGVGDGIRGTMSCPGDADTILSVGAISIPGSLAYFSSTGPTNDGRIKPDIVAPGVSIYGATTPGPTNYMYEQGVSSATPITAGIAALLLSARPELTPIQVRDAIRNTADRIEAIRFPNHPNNFVGWGKVNALSAISYHGPVFSHKPNIYLSDSTYQIQIKVLSKYGIRSESVLFNYSTDNTDQPTLVMNLENQLYYPTSGLYSITIPQQPKNSIIRFKINAADSGSNSYSTPSPTVGQFWEFTYGDSTIKPIVTNFSLSQNYPNPFGYRTIILFNSPIQTEGEVSVYNVIGQKVKTIYHGIINKGANPYYWYGLNDDGVNVASGVYFYRVRTKDFVADRKMLLSR